MQEVMRNNQLLRDYETDTMHRESHKTTNVYTTMNLIMFTDSVTRNNQILCGHCESKTVPINFCYYRINTAQKHCYEITMFFCGYTTRIYFCIFAFSYTIY